MKNKNVMTQETNSLSVSESKKMIKKFMDENSILFAHIELFLDDYDIVCIPRNEYDMLEMKDNL